MHDIKNLEALWEQYHKNKRKLYYMYGLSVFFLLVGGYYLVTHASIFSTDFISNDTKKHTIVVETKKSKPINHFLLNDALKIIEKKKIELLKPLAISEEHLVKEKVAEIPTLPVVNEIPIIENSSSYRIPKKKTERKKQYKKVNSIKEEPRKKMHLNIIKSSSKSAYMEVEKRFNHFRDPDDSLFLAKMYYEKNDYIKAEEWALKTNKINNNIEESWIIFAKAKIKSGKIDEAIHILKNYIRQSNSQAAKILLLKIKK